MDVVAVEDWAGPLVAYLKEGQVVQGCGVQAQGVVWVVASEWMWAAGVGGGGQGRAVGHSVRLLVGVSGTSGRRSDGRRLAAAALGEGVASVGVLRSHRVALVVTAQARAGRPARARPSGRAQQAGPARAGTRVNRATQPVPT